MPDKKRNRQRIITAAVSLFRHTHNVKKVSLETIAREAGVSPATIYNNFGNRENLLYEVIKVLVKENIERNSSIVRSDIPFPQKISGIMSGKLDMASQLDSELINKMVSQDITIAPFIDKIYENEIKILWHELIIAGKKEGYIDDALDDKILLIYLDVVKEGLGARKNVFQDIKDNLNLIKQLTQIMFYGFLKKDIGLFQ